MGFGDFEDICRTAPIPSCALVGPTSPLTGTQGMLPTCYSRNIEVANTIIFQGANDVLHIAALAMTAIMIIHVRSKFTAVGMCKPFFKPKQPRCTFTWLMRLHAIGRKEITTFFYMYMALTICSLIVDSGVTPPGSAPFPYFVALQNAFTSALCTSLLINGFVGFQLYEDGTALSVWLLRLSSLGIFVVSGAVSLLTYKGWGGLSPTNTVGLFVVLYILNALCLAVYLVMQIILVVNTLQDRWPLFHIGFGVGFFIIGQVILYAFSDIICENVKHYLDGLFFTSLCNLLSVMMVYKVRLTCPLSCTALVETNITI